MNKLSSKLVIPFVLFTAFGVSNIANADSGTSALPPKDPAYKTYMYNLYAPKTQTYFKLLDTVQQPVSKVMQDSNSFIIYGGALTGGGTAATNLVKGLENTPYVGAGVRAVNTAGGVMLLIGTAQYASYQQFQQGSIIKYNVYFRWTDPERLEYAVKIDSWVEYNGTKVSAIRTSTYTKTA